MVLSMDRWIGKVAIVTGASAGIGEAIAEQLVKEGLLVLGTARRVELIEEKAKKLLSEKGKLYGIKADFSKEQDILKTFQWASENLGPVHILINNVGVHAPGSILDQTTENMQYILSVNTLGLSIATREAIKIMRAHDIKGHVIHINSIFGHYIPNLGGHNIYMGSKFAVTALTEVLRQELARIGSKIKVTSLSPGLVRTELTTVNATPHQQELYGHLVALDPQDIADGIIYALSTPEHVQVHELMIRPVGETY